MKVKVIYKEKYLAGLLWRDENGYHFEYDNDFIKNEDSYPISVNMPKSQKTYHLNILFPLFQSMLSEGYNRELQCKALGIDTHDDWNLLINTC
ncbi:MAG: HipA N-terminal domain-containing protein, partial [Candidatus Marinimicrobia bacterium]|nr:HipA N-terminal domain-containing protein [Candidatus Neomarinimicrobiota bacterium]